MPPFFQHWVVSLALSRSGPVLLKAVTAAAAFGSAKAAFLIPGLNQVITPEVLTGVLWCVIDAAVNRLPASILTEYGKDIQTSLNVAGANLKVDGIPLAKTAAAAAQVAGRAG
jgi:hypothetical protein